MLRIHAVICAIFLGFLSIGWNAKAAAPSSADWPMLARDETRSGSTPVALQPPFERKWHRLFIDEGLMSGIQPIVADGNVFIGTMAGMLYAIDAESGEDVWIFDAGGPILHTAAFAEGRVFFGAADGLIYAVDARTGELAWTVETKAAIWNAPVVSESLVMIGSRDGSLYAVDATSGLVQWSTPTGGPILNSPSVDRRRTRVYVGSEDMHVYAISLDDGAIEWKSPKLPGVSLRGYHPVIAPNGSVMVTVTPVTGGDAFQDLLVEMANEIFGGFASWRHSQEENDRLRAANFEQMQDPQSYRDQLDYIRRRLSDEPSWQTFFVLDPDSGEPRFVVPIVYSESMNGPGMPPVVTPDGQVIVKYQALLRSRYQHYSPFLNPGYLDINTGHIEPIMDQSRTYGWYDGQRLVHDEQCQWVVADRLLINTAQDVVVGLNLDTLAGFSQPFCRNIHEPKPSEALSILLRTMRNEELPVGKEWIIRGTGVYGGGSVMATPIAIAGDSFYYIPTHELNTGAALIAYRMDPEGTASVERPAVSEAPTDNELNQIHELPWDWDTLEAHRMSEILDSLPEPVPGTLRRPLLDEAERRVDALKDAELDRYIWETRDLGGYSSSSNQENDPLRTKLEMHVSELISRTWRPLLMPAGKHPREAFRIFVEPTETLETLARAYPHVNETLQAEIRAYITAMAATNGPLDGPTGRSAYDPSVGENREAYNLPPMELLQRSNEWVRTDLARLYPLWLWAYASGEWRILKERWPQLRALADETPSPVEEDCRNGRVAGLIAYCRIAQQLGDEDALTHGLDITRAAIRERIKYEWTHTRGGVVRSVPPGRMVFSRWRNLTPETARICRDHALETQQRSMDVYVDYHRPTWQLAWNIEYLWRNENPIVLPTAAKDIFTARAWILEEPAEKLATYLDLPWCRADLYYIQKLIMCLETGERQWIDVR